jgi:hypothetical protein
MIDANMPEISIYQRFSGIYQRKRLIYQRKLDFISVSPILSANQKIDCTSEVNIKQTLKYRWGVTNVCYI